MNTQKYKKIVIKVQEAGIMVYEELSASRIDLFKNTEDGMKQALQLVQTLLKE